jgi:hypothetical protein
VSQKATCESNKEWWELMGKLVAGNWAAELMKRGLLSGVDFLNALTLHSNLHPITGPEALRKRRCLLSPNMFPVTYVRVLGIPNTLCKTMGLFAYVLSLCTS